MKRILIIGNSGSGKSWLAARLAEGLTIREVNLDTIVWQPGGFNQKRPQHEIDHAIQTLAQAPSWVVEGVFGALAEQLLDAADTLLFLDLDWSVCRDSLLSRGSQSARQRDTVAAEESFQQLLVWASEYGQRAGKSSRHFHRELFDRFPNDKHRFTTRAEVNRYLTQLTVNS
ncbi:P-loop NTPase family protein [Aeromonas veronii]|uniref:AAA family ATPase n=1 Tax=Aeromonas veronii TaxID=654 RepID=A0AAN1UPB2_AERVE|nr:AAA family ATPase [Aeromonas veronii]AYV36548.1 AAA family ATPase [Aeromonas veronii]MCX0435128.1 AAA family ATPase [Aeromonas veronii]MCX0438223.1 AAA family ATPase [Aeromonas veronii]